VKVLDRWVDQGPTSYSVTRLLSDGAHEVVLEYYENGGGAVARLAYEQTGVPPPPVTPFAAEYFSNRTLDGAPAIARDDPEIGFDWGAQSPDAAVPVDNFSARWTRTAHMEAGTYRFSVTGDDGIRLYLDGTLVIDGWGDHPPNDVHRRRPTHLG
jgi:hypothetical protein